MASTENSMKLMLVRMIGLLVLVLAVLVSPMWRAQAQTAEATDSRMAPLDQYLMDRDAEIALARSAAPKGISDEAEVLVLERQGYKTGVKGTNGFVCLVERSWTDAIDNPEFWNAKRRSPMCLNAAAARTYLPLTIAKTKLVLAGKSKEQISDAIKTALDKKELPPIERGAVCYMMSKEGHLNDHDGHWHPHVMFYAPLGDAKSWGANLAGSPMVAAEDTLDRLTVFMVPVGNWSDGTPDSGQK
jgi:hypothetical protein